LLYEINVKKTAVYKKKFNGDIVSYTSQTATIKRWHYPATQRHISINFCCFRHV